MWLKLVSKSTGLFLEMTSIATHLCKAESGLSNFGGVRGFSRSDCWSSCSS